MGAIGRAAAYADAQGDEGTAARGWSMLPHAPNAVQPLASPVAVIIPLAVARIPIGS